MKTEYEWRCIRMHKGCYWVNEIDDICNTTMILSNGREGYALAKRLTKHNISGFNDKNFKKYAK